VSHAQATMVGEIREQAATVEIQVHDAGNRRPQLRQNCQSLRCGCRSD